LELGKGLDIFISSNAIVMGTKLTLFLAMMVSFTVTAQDFRSFYWGDSKDDVIALEGQPIHDENGKLSFFEQQLFSRDTLDVRLIYTFKEGKLVNGVSLVIDKDRSYKAYEVILQKLESEYGNPSQMSQIWAECDDDHQKREKVEMIRRGGMNVYALFTNNRTEAWAMMSGSDGYLTISYGSRSKEVTTSSSVSNQDR
jgi:hypothetical protein